MTVWSIIVTTCMMHILTILPSMTLTNLMLEAINNIDSIIATTMEKMLR